MMSPFLPPETKTSQDLDAVRTGTIVWRGEGVGWGGGGGGGGGGGAEGRRMWDITGGRKHCHITSTISGLSSPSCLLHPVMSYILLPLAAHPPPLPPTCLSPMLFSKSQF